MWTFVVAHGPIGASSPQAALVDYFEAGPLGGFSRTELRAQAEQVAAEVQRAAQGRQIAFSPWAFETSK